MKHFRDISNSKETLKRERRFDETSEFVAMKGILVGLGIACDGMWNQSRVEQYIGELLTTSSIWGYAITKGVHGLYNHFSINR